METFDFPNLVAALDGNQGVTDKGFNFLGRDGEELFYSFDGLRTEAMRRGAWLRSKGMQKGDRLAMVMPDGEDFVPTFMGAVWAGIAPVPLYPPLSLGKLDAYIDALVSIMTKAEPTYLATNSKLEAVLWSGAHMFAATAVKPELDEKIKRPYSTVVWKHWWKGDLAISRQSIDMAGNPPKGPKQAWNLGQKAGLRGDASLVPLYLWWALCAWWLVRALRRTPR